MPSHARSSSTFRVGAAPPYDREDLTRPERENQALRAELNPVQRQVAMMSAMQASIADDLEALQEIGDKRFRATPAESGKNQSLIFRARTRSGCARRRRHNPTHLLLE